MKVKSLSHVRLLAGPEGVLICNLPVEGDSGGSMAGRRTSVLVFFEERIQQRDRDCKADKVYGHMLIFDLIQGAP